MHTPQAVPVYGAIAGDAEDFSLPGAEHQHVVTSPEGLSVPAFHDEGNGGAQSRRSLQDFFGLDVEHGVRGLQAKYLHHDPGDDELGPYDIVINPWDRDVDQGSRTFSPPAGILVPLLLLLARGTVDWVVAGGR